VIAPYIISPRAGISNRAKGVSVTYAATAPLATAVANAQAADVAIVFVSTSSSEGGDRGSLSLGNGQDMLVSSVAAAQPNTIVVLHCPGAVLMPWADSVEAIVTAFMPGQETGNAIASILFGDVNPSGRLPVTFPMSENQQPANTTARYPGINEQAEYSEGLFVGYRWYDAMNENPLFPFGHGLSYTNFQYSALNVAGLTISGVVQNIGTVQGTEVVQLYISYPMAAQEPPKVLRGFTKIPLAAGASGKFQFTLTQDDLSVWDVTTSSWKVIHGTFDVLIGSSSRDIRLKGTLMN